jgi:hypothetical protein
MTELQLTKPIEKNKEITELESSLLVEIFSSNFTFFG